MTSMVAIARVLQRVECRIKQRQHLTQDAIRQLTDAELARRLAAACATLPTRDPLRLKMQAALRGLSR